MSRDNKVRSWSAHEMLGIGVVNICATCFPDGKYQDVPGQKVLGPGGVLHLENGCSEARSQLTEEELRNATIDAGRGRPMSHTGSPSWPRNPEDIWYYWLDGKQGYPSGTMWATTRTAVRRMIKERHPNSSIDEVLHYDQYHCLSKHCPADRR